ILLRPPPGSPLLPYTSLFRPWRADKARRVKPPVRHEALPDWIVRGNEPVPLTAAFRAQIMTTRIHAFIMSLIDGKRSLKDIAKRSEEHTSELQSREKLVCRLL